MLVAFSHFPQRTGSRSFHAPSWTRGWPVWPTTLLPTFCGDVPVRTLSFFFFYLPLGGFDSPGFFFFFSLLTIQNPSHASWWPSSSLPYASFARAVLAPSLFPTASADHNLPILPLPSRPPPIEGGLIHFFYSPDKIFRSVPDATFAVGLRRFFRRHFSRHVYNTLTVAGPGCAFAASPSPTFFYHLTYQDSRLQEFSP